jgi:hypothetical protein
VKISVVRIGTVPQAGLTPAQQRRGGQVQRHPGEPEHAELPQGGVQGKAATDQHGHQHGQHGQTLEGDEVGQQGGQVADPLLDGQFRGDEWILRRPQHREVAPGPAVALQEEGGQVVGGQSLDQCLVVVAGVPALAVQPDGGVEVLGHRLGGDPADPFQGLAADDGGGTTPEGPVVAVLARHDHLEEHALIVAARLEVLEGVVVAEVVRCLDQRHRGIVEVADRGVEDVGLGDVVGVEDEDQLPVGVAQCVVDVAGLGVLIGGAGQIARSEPSGQVGDLVTVAVVEDPSGVGIGDPVAAHQGGHEDVQPLVVGTDEDIDGRPSFDGRPGRDGDPPSQKGEGGQHGPTEQLARQQDEEHDRLSAVSGIGRPPNQVGGAPDQGEHDQSPDHQGIILVRGGRVRRRLAHPLSYRQSGGHP